jgi:hypothetical protein
VLLYEQQNAMKERKEKKRKETSLHRQGEYGATKVFFFKKKN